MKTKTNQSIFVDVFPYSANEYLKNKHYRLFLLYNWLKNQYYNWFPPKHLIDYKQLASTDIPVVLINFNRHKSLVQQVDWLLQLETPVSIIIIDNASTYPPLLQYYSKIQSHNKVQVIRYTQNNGLRKLIAISQTLQAFDYYVVSDTDLVPYEHTPTNILQQLQHTLEKYPELNHVGVSLEVDDLPDYYPLKKEVLEWEKQFWIESIDDFTYHACVDTTFAMYRKNSIVSRIQPAARLKRPYTLKHLDWYLNPANLSAETMHLLSNLSPMSTWMTKLTTENKLPTSSNQKA